MQTIQNNLIHFLVSLLVFEKIVQHYQFVHKLKAQNRNVLLYAEKACNKLPADLRPVKSMQCFMPAVFKACNSADLSYGR
jgi:hypothetical protein